MSPPKLPRFATGERPFTASEFAHEAWSQGDAYAITIPQRAVQALLDRVFELEQAALLAGHKIEVKVDGEDVTTPTAEGE